MAEKSKDRMYDEIFNAVEQTEAVIFDLGNVLVAFEWENYVRSSGRILIWKI